MKLFTIGDSISQGFMSLAAARTELSYSTLIARALGLTPGTADYPIPLWGAGGLPLNIESLLRRLYRKYGNDIRGPIEWPLAVASVNDFLDEVEDFYERGPGNIALPQAGERQFFPNVSVAGFTIADSWMVTPDLCLDRITHDADNDDGFFALPNRRFERTAHAVLNPSRNPAFGGLSQLEWLKYHHHHGGGVDNLVLWLGSNNALGTIVRMRIDDTENAPQHPLKMTLDQRDQYNLWSVDHFADEFRELMKRVHATLTDASGKTDCKVFVGTVPPVTVAPLARGVGAEVSRPDPFGVLPSATYFERYTYFLFDLDYARRSKNSLSVDEVYGIDSRIAEYNKVIRSEVAAYNAKAAAGRKVTYVLVDIADQLLKLAFKRNNGKPLYKLPAPLVAINDRLNNSGKSRTVNTIYYTVDRLSRMTAGGIFSLDGVHPAALGHGLIAEEFLKAMTATGVATGALDWSAIVASDSLYANPLPIMPELYDNTRLAEMLLDVLRLP